VRPHQTIEAIIIIAIVVLKLSRACRMLLYKANMPSPLASAAPPLRS
jgi:hypothetical protein